MSNHRQILELNRKRYTLTLNGAEAIVLGGLVAELELYSPARRDLHDKVAELRGQVMRDREQVYANV